jgi:hypothetical protein
MNSMNYSRWFPRLVLTVGLATLGHVVAREAAADSKDSCWQIPSPSTRECYCDNGSLEECVFDADCQDLYPLLCEMT